MYQIQKWIWWTTKNPGICWKHCIISACSGVNTERKSTHWLWEKCPNEHFHKTRLQHNDDPILSLRSPNKLYITFIYYSLVIMFTLCHWFDQKTRIAFSGSFSLPKIGIPMLKIACINLWWYDKET